MDAETVKQVTDQAATYFTVLTGLARHHTALNGPKVDTSTTPSAPLNLTMHDIAQDIHAVLRDLALDLAERTNEWPDQLDTEGATMFIHRHATLVAGHEGMRENLPILKDLMERAHGPMGLLPRRTRIPEYCECGTVQWCYHEQPPFVKCKAGHIALLADHAYRAGAEAYTATQAARLIGVSVATIGRMIERGDLYGKKGTLSSRAYVDGASLSVYMKGLAA